MKLDRRSLLKGLAGAAAAPVAASGVAQARERVEAEPDAAAMLYDSTRCIGCQACVVACREANDLEPVTDEGYGDGLYDAPADLSCDTLNIIKLRRDGSAAAYVKQQCMHCVDPACVGACMIGALQKRERGVVTWEGSQCIGCRYCQAVCPFNVPKFEWESRNPRIVKCELCSHRLAEGLEPACCDVCPREAVVFGTREQMLTEARERLAASPGSYVPKVYGEHDVGGTQVLYLARVPFEDLGLPDLGDDGVPHLQQAVQHGVYQGFVAPAALYCVLAGVMLRNRKANSDPEQGGGA